MKRLLFFINVLFSGIIIAQEVQTKGCTTHSLSDAVLEANPEQKEQFLKAEAGFQDYLKQKSTLYRFPALSPNKKIIPVVVHVIHNGVNSASNISNAQVQSAIDQATEDFMLTNEDTVDVVPFFKPRIGKMNVEFRLAKIDPNGNCTSGITRHESSLTNSAGEVLKDIVKWDVKKYLNVWVCQSIASGAGGYTYRPYNAPNGDTDAGILVVHTQFGQFGTTPSSALLSVRTLSHEIGHYLGLPHTWGPTNTPGDPDNCNFDDGIADTPNTIGATTCDLDFPACDSGIANVQNIMCYAGCPIMFTKGQVERVQYYLDTYTVGGAPRHGLWQESNLIATGTNDGYVAQECPSTPLFETDIKTICPGEEIQFTNLSYGPHASTYSWTFEGGTPVSSSDSNPTITYNTPGLYKVKLLSSIGGTSKELTKTEYINVVSSIAPYQGPLVENFENEIVLNESTNAWSWYTSSESSSSSTFFKRNSAASSNNGTFSVRARTKNSSIKFKTYITTRVIDASDMTSTLKLVFDRAYRKLSNDSKDRLRVYVSADCGLTWTSEKYFSTSTLATVSGNQSSTFIPSASDWEQTIVDLSKPEYLGNDKLYVRFMLEGSKGNYLYLDNINITTGLETEEIQKESTNLEIFPNPVIGKDINLSFRLNEDADYQLKIVDALGRTVKTLSTKGNKGENNLKIDNNLSKGLYWIEITTSEIKMTKKFQVQ
jgi:PKD repeat protein